MTTSPLHEKDFEAPTQNTRITADAVVLSYDDDLTAHVLLVKRKYPPFQGAWVLPGGHVEDDETVEEGFIRELAEESGITLTKDNLFRLVGVYSKPDRDPRGRYVSAAFGTILQDLPEPTAGDDAEAARWVPVLQALEEGLAFDHGEMLLDAVVILLGDGVA
jgi:8-oxo-dGTP diphosphatase